MRKEIIVNINNKRENRVKEANVNSIPFKILSQRWVRGAEKVISFEHINSHGIDSHDDFAELPNTMRFLDQMEAGVYSVVETQWDTTSPTFSRFIHQKIKY